MKVINKVAQKKAVKEINVRAVAAPCHAMCPKCLRGKG